MNYSKIASVVAVLSIAFASNVHAIEKDVCNENIIDLGSATKLDLKFDPMMDPAKALQLRKDLSIRAWVAFWLYDAGQYDKAQFVMSIYMELLNSYQASGYIDLGDAGQPNLLAQQDDANDCVNDPPSPESPPATSRSISGVVEGTIIVAHNPDGSPYATESSTDGQLPDSSGHFPFILRGLPANFPVMISLIEDGRVFPMYFDDGINRIILDDEELTLDLDLVTSDENGRATPFFNLLTKDGVTGNGENTEFTEVRPVTAGLTVKEAIDKGEDVLRNGWLTGANIYFERAITSIVSSTTTSDADYARFMYALTHTISWITATQSDGYPGDLNRVGDMLDQLGAPIGETRINLDSIQIPDNLPVDSPTAIEYQNFLYDIPRDNIQKSIEQLEEISDAFQKTVDNPLADEVMEVDYGDVLILRAALRMLVASIDFQQAYNLDVDIDAEQEADTTIEALLEVHPDFLALRDNTDPLADSKQNIESALDELEAGINFIALETDSQIDDFITIDPTEIAEALDWVAQAKLAFSTGEYTADEFTPDEFTLSIFTLFNGVDFRNPTPGLLPPYIGDNRGCFPDESLGGLIEGVDLNDDDDVDPCIPDVLP